MRLWANCGSRRIALILTAGMVAVTVVLNVLGPYRWAGDRRLHHSRRPARPGMDLPVAAGIHTLNSLLTWLQSYVMAGRIAAHGARYRNDCSPSSRRYRCASFDQALRMAT